MKDINELGIESTDLSEQCKNKAYEKVVYYVKEKITGGEFKIGDKLPTERELSERLELSRNSVREALRTLDNMGLIACRQGSGNYLVGDMQQIIEESIYMMSILKQINDKDICNLRRGIDVLSMQLAVKNYDDSKRNEIENLINQISVAAVDKKAVFVDKEVHMLISRYSDNKLVEMINDSLSITMEKFISKARANVIENEIDLLNYYHKEMLEALVERNTDKGVEAINKHYDAIEKYI